MHIVLGALIFMVAIFAAVHLHVWMHPAGPAPRAKRRAQPEDSARTRQRIEQAHEIAKAERRMMPGRIVSSFEGAANSTVTRYDPAGMAGLMGYGGADYYSQQMNAAQQQQMANAMGQQAALARLMKGLDEE